MALIVVIVIVALVWVLRLYTYVMIARLIFDWVRVFNPRFRPRGAFLVLIEGMYTITDPPIKMFRRILPPIRLGQISLDLGWMLTMIVCWILIGLLGVLAAAVAGA